MLNTIEVACPKCHAEPGSHCVGLRGKTAGQTLLSGPHTEREEAARQAPDPDLSGRPDVELCVPCSLCPAGVGERCGSSSLSNGPFKVGDYHQVRTARAKAWVPVLRALPSHLSSNWALVVELEKLPALAGVDVGKALTSMREAVPPYAQNDGGRPARWGYTIQSVVALRRLDDLQLQLMRLTAAQPPAPTSDQPEVAAPSAEETPGAAEPHPVLCAGHPVAICDHEDCGTCPHGFILDAPPVETIEPPVETTEPPVETPPPAVESVQVDDVSRRYLTRNLLCQLADDEIAEKAVEVFALEREIEAVKQQAKEEIKPKQDRMGALKDEIRKGRFEDVRCVEEKDWSTNTLTVRRLDLAQVIESRALTADERQRELFAAAEAAPVDRLPRALQAVGVQAEIRDVLHGPRLDRYQLLLGAAKDLKTFTAAQVKLAFELGIEQRLLTWRQGSEPRSLELDVPRPPETWQRFGLADLRTWVDSAPAGAGLPLCPGVDVLGRPYWLDLARAPHLLVAGATGSGKSVCLHSMLCSLLMTRPPSEVRFYMLDPKRVELRAYANADHEVQIVSDRDDMADLLSELVTLMEHRYLELEKLGVRDLDGARAAGSTMPRIVVVVEELADLVIGGGAAELSLVKLAQKSRAAGIHLLLATQRPDADTFSGLLRSNVDARIALAVQKASESRIILDQDGAESLLKPGDMLIRFGGQVTRAHGLYLSQEEIASVVSPPDPAVARCRVCGCTEDHACPGGCYWVDDPQGGDLCSACLPDEAEGEDLDEGDDFAAEFAEGVVDGEGL